MPDPDLGPVIIGSDLVEHLKGTMGILPDAEIDMLMEGYGLSVKDAMSLILLDDGGRIQYFYNVLDALEARLHDGPEMEQESSGMADRTKSHARLVANWCLHELGRLTAGRDHELPGRSPTPEDLGMTIWGECRVPAPELAEILFHLHTRRITAKTAKELLWAVFRGDIRQQGYKDITDAIEKTNLWYKELSDEEYWAIADRVVHREGHVLHEFERFIDGKSKTYPQGKLMYLVGKMMRAGPEEKMDPKSAEKAMRARIEACVEELRAPGQ
jgi:aspartyl-tRNA(Asn)/glutamyl-tRNA(Gln) amidotransferase subunit B